MILVGRVAGGFGVRGEVRITTFTEDPLSLNRYGALKREDGTDAPKLKSVRAAKGGVIARVEGVETKDAADALRGLRLYVPREALPKPAKDEFYLTDLIGLRVEGLDGAALGVVAAVPNFGAGDILEIDKGDGTPTWYLPFTREAVPEVRIAERKIIANPPTEVSEQDER
jgi:16S rRNA processing protein RimM